MNYYFYRGRFMAYSRALKVHLWWNYRKDRHHKTKAMLLPVLVDRVQKN
jgi:hypothetical protein